jgi:CSLREA domain-containing protein
VLAAFPALGQDRALASSTIVVDSTADGNTADGVLTLREAILLANGASAERDDHWSREGSRTRGG